MPLYQLKCPCCGRNAELFRRIAEYNDLPACFCGAIFERMVAAPAVIGEISPYISPGTNRWVSSRVEMRNDLKVSGCILSESGLKEDIARNKAAAKEKAFAPIAASIDQAVSALVSAGKIES